MKRVNIDALSFSLLNDDTLRQRSVVSIDVISSSTDKGTARKVNHIGTITDPRLGTITPGNICSTCSNPPELCNGHTGHIELCMPVLSGMFIPSITKVLNSICISCGHLLLVLSREKRRVLMSIPIKKRLTELNNRSLRVRGPCTQCTQIQPMKWILFESILARPCWKKDLSSHPPTIDPSHVATLLDLITTEDAKLFGFTAPSSPTAMYMSTFPIPPILMRPSRSIKSEDDLTTRLRQIVTGNTSLSQHLEIEIDLSMWNDRTEIHTAPAKWKPRHQKNKKILVPFQLEWYFDLQRQCAGFQDAKYCTKGDLDYGRDLSSVRHRFAATRHRRGRIRANILGKRGDFTARAVASPNTYIDPHEVGVPISICMHLTIQERVHQYNYDRLMFLVYQGPGRYPGANYIEREGTRYLLPLFMSGGLQVGDIVYRHLVQGDVVIMNRQPSLHRFSMMGYQVVPMHCDTFQLHLSVTAAHNLDFDGDEVNMFIPGSLEATAEICQLMSVEHNLLKDGSMLIQFVQHACLGAYLLTKDPTLMIPSNILGDMWFHARLDTSVLVPGQGRIGRVIMQDLLPTYDGTFVMTKKHMNKLAYTYLTTSKLSSVEQSKWIGSTVRFLEEFLMRYGSTLGYMDCCSLTKHETPLIQVGVDIMSKDIDETRVIKLTDALRDSMGTWVQEELETRKEGNNLIDIVESGAKGNRSHIVQNVGMVGQQFDTNSKRHVSLSSHDAPDAVLRGFIASSFSDGLDAIEFFHHLSSSRVGLIGTAVSTADTGYCYRRISKCLEDIRVGFDHSVRTSSNQLIMTTAGFNTDLSYLVPARFLHTPNIRDLHTTIGEQECAHLKSLRLLCMEYRCIHDSIHLPFDITKLPTGPVGGTMITPEMIRVQVQQLWMYLLAHYIPNTIEPVFFDHLSSHVLWMDHQVRTQIHLDTVLEYVKHHLCHAMYDPGTPIGLITSQSFSEPLTQIQLNKFHHSGEGTGLVNGVSRIKEIINCMKTIQTPSMNIILLHGHTVDPQELLEITFKDVMAGWTDERDGFVTIELKKSFMIDRHLSPRMIAHAMDLGMNIQYTRNLEDPKWSIWYVSDPSPTVHMNPSIWVRTQVRQLVKKNKLLRGIRHLRDFYWTEISIDTVCQGVLVKEDRKCLVTAGSNLVDILCLPWVDVEHTTTNDLMEMYDVYGVDAMCKAIEHNLMSVMTSNSASVSRKYIQVIANEMCRTGVPCALTFTGLTQSKTSTLKLATFERSLDSFFGAACDGHHDELKGISESVIVGKPVSVGTGGDFSVLSSLLPDDMSSFSSSSCIKTNLPYLYPPIPCDVSSYEILPTIVVKKNNRKRPLEDDTVYMETSKQKRRKNLVVHDDVSPLSLSVDVTSTSLSHDNPFLNKRKCFSPFQGKE
jgi:DNA-directed RNA polymerase beta' subunit